MAFTGAAIFGAAASIGGAAASIAGAASAIMPIISAGAGVAGIFQTISGATQKAAAPPMLQQAPRVPDYLQIETAEKQKILRTAQNRTRTVLTNPMGEVESVIKAKQLVGKLGQ